MAITKKADSKKPKTVKRTRAPKRSDASTQASGFELIQAKDHVLDVINHTVNDWENYHSLENATEDSSFELMNDLYETMMKRIIADHVGILKSRQLELELKAGLAFQVAATYLSINKLTAFARSFQSLSKASINLAFSLTNDTSELPSTTSYPKWTEWNNVADAMNTVFVIEKQSIENFKKLKTLLDDEDQDILEKKIKITDHLGTLMDAFKDAKAIEDLIEIDKQMLMSKKSPGKI